MPGEFELEERFDSASGRCWCGREIPAGVRRYMVAKFPPPLRILRTRRFHSAACALDFAANMATVLEANLTQLGTPERHEELAHERALWLLLVDHLAPIASEREPSPPRRASR